MVKYNITANKGDWSEFYAFLKILELRKLSAADKNLNAIEGKFFVFQKIIREEKDEPVKIYDISQSDTQVIITDENGVILKIFRCEDLNAKTLKIFERIRNGKSAAFQILEAENIMRELLCTKVKASNQEKADIVAIIYDRISETMPMLGFSVKSMVGGASTLFNAGKTTNFVFSVSNLGHDNIDEINSISGKSKIKDRVAAVIKKGGVFEFQKVVKNELETNLRKIDTIFSEFVAKMLFDYFSGKANKVSDLVNLLSEDEKLNERYKLSAQDYEFKMKNFLVAVALGMVPSIEWDGFIKAHGGYIVVKENGDIVCYHLYNRDEFLSYLYENTKFESAGSKKHGYGKLYEKDGQLLFNLNLQIRFIK